MVKNLWKIGNVNCEWSLLGINDFKYVHKTVIQMIFLRINIKTLVHLYLFAFMWSIFCFYYDNQTSRDIFSTFHTWHPIPFIHLAFRILIATPLAINFWAQYNGIHQLRFSHHFLACQNNKQLTFFLWITSIYWVHTFHFQKIGYWRSVTLKM